MTAIDLQLGQLSARISTKGGTLLGFWFATAAGHRVPLLRQAADDDADALQSACYPLVPFGNRVKDNRFTFRGQDHAFKPNTDWDRHYLHGEGWLAEWTIVSHENNRAELCFSHRADNATPYSYDVTQSFFLQEGALQLTLEIANRGTRAMPFGLGWHPYFPMTPGTTLKASSQRFWTEVAEWLPGEPAEIPADLDFSTPRGLPHRWVNNGFEGWAGTAEIRWPERRTMLAVDADPLFKHAFLFVSDRAFDPSFKRDYFCFEPMSHLANSHNMSDLGGLVVLDPGQALSGSVRLRPMAI